MQATGISAKGVPGIQLTPTGEVLLAKQPVRSNASSKALAKDSNFFILTPIGTALVLGSF